MKPDTPLPEVARHLPTRAAEQLLKEPYLVQEMTCQFIKDAVVFWEEQGAALDPLSYQAVLNSLVAQNIVVARRLLSLYAENELLRSPFDDPT